MLTATPATAAPAKSTSGGWIEIHPRYREWLRKCGLASAGDLLSLRGEVVGGHADRHVVKVELHSGASARGAYLKREHVVGRKSRCRNWRDGFGWVSRAQREAKTLQKLEELGLPGPQWLAYGEDGSGHAFLLIEELTGARPLREFLSDYALSAEELRLVTERLGRMLAECHAAGIGTPELSAKHILVRRGDLQPTLIDWQSATRNCPVTAEQIAAWFGRLHATLPAECLPLRTRLRMLWAYRRVLKSGGQATQPRFAAFVRTIAAAAEKAGGRSSVRQQLGAADAAPQRLVWLDGEAFVAIPEVAAQWPQGEPYDPESGSLTGVAVHFSSFAPLGRLTASLRERPWRSPGATAARVLFHLQRFGIAGPKLLAFGQRSTWFRVNSFVAAAPLVPVHTMAIELAPWNSQRELALGDIGRMLKRLHDAGLRPLRTVLGVDPLLIAATELTVASPVAVRIVRRVTEKNARADLKFALIGMDHLDKMLLLRGYLGENASEKSKWDSFAGAVY